MSPRESRGGWWRYEVERVVRGGDVLYSSLRGAGRTVSLDAQTQSTRRCVDRVDVFIGSFRGRGTPRRS
ncbi:hypothetical protein C8Q78DRAFT_1014147 [Trametes maxima]|nr:hypothetical protein C8Q78DRAFT_1014147 [Trametes maxima]